MLHTCIILVSSFLIYFLCICHSEVFLLYKVGSSLVDDQIGLDVHAINELKDKGFKATDDSPKYKYQANESGSQYGE